MDGQTITNPAAHMALGLSDPDLERLTPNLTGAQHEAIEEATLCRTVASHLIDEMDLHRQSGAREAARSCYRLSNRLNALADRLEQRAGIPMDEHDANGGA